MSNNNEIFNAVFDLIINKIADRIVNNADFIANVERKLVDDHSLVTKSDLGASVREYIDHEFVSRSDLDALEENLLERITEVEKSIPDENSETSESEIARMVDNYLEEQVSDDESDFMRSVKSFVEDFDYSDIVEDRVTDLFEQPSSKLKESFEELVDERISEFDRERIEPLARIVFETGEAATLVKTLGKVILKATETVKKEEPVKPAHVMQIEELIAHEQAPQWQTLPLNEATLGHVFAQSPNVLSFYEALAKLCQSKVGDYSMVVFHSLTDAVRELYTTSKLPFNMSLEAAIEAIVSQYRKSNSAV